MFFFINIPSTRINQPLSHFFQVKAGVPIMPANLIDDNAEVKKKWKYKVAGIAKINNPILGIEYKELECAKFTKELDDDKELRDTDYLMSAKGSIKGISLRKCRAMLEKAAENGEKIIANSSFYVIRPHNNSIYGDHIDFLHSMLDAMVFFLEKTRINKDGVERSYFTIQDLLNIVVSYPKENIEDKVIELEILSRKYNNRLEELSDAMQLYYTALDNAIGDYKLIDFNIGTNDASNQGNRTNISRKQTVA